MASICEKEEIIEVNNELEKFRYLNYGGSNEMKREKKNNTIGNRAKIKILVQFCIKFKLGNCRNCLLSNDVKMY